MKFIIVDKNSSDFNIYKEQIYILRHKVFKEKLNWKVDSIGGNKEIDYFDSLEIVYYIIVINDSNRVLGCMRFLPTTQDYMLEKVFPELLVNHPKNFKIWEISRFAIDPNIERNNTIISLNLTTLLLLEGMCQFAKINNIHKFLAATTVTLHRLIKTINIDSYIIGNTLKIDKTTVIALEVLMNEKTFNGVKTRLLLELNH